MNIGNVYFKQRLFAKAIKNYRMALDQVPNNTHASMKYVRFAFCRVVCLRVPGVVEQLSLLMMMMMMMDYINVRPKADE